MTWRQEERGATALIVVMFTILLLMTISVGFVRLVVKDQGRTTDDELSRGAYDSAMAGVEDGKRVLQACLGNGDATACAAMGDACNTIRRAKILSATAPVTTDEVRLRTDITASGDSFDQAYTCVKIDRNTDDYKGSLKADTTQIVRLDTTAPFTQISVSWFLSAKAVGAIDLPMLATGTLPAADDWPLSRPPMLRVQLMQYKNGDFRLNDFDEGGSTESGSSTLYLNPSEAGDTSLNFGSDDRRNFANNLVRPVVCDKTGFSTYACRVSITLPNPIGGSSSDRRAYLRLVSIYGDTDFMIQPVGTQLRDVQPAIDSTGRANNVFRRVQARVEMTNGLDAQLYPRATVDITKNFCKDFSVSNTDFFAGSCDYTQP